MLPLTSTCSYTLKTPPCVPLHHFYRSVAAAEFLVYLMSVFIGADTHNMYFVTILCVLQLRTRKRRTDTPLRCSSIPTANSNYFTFLPFSSKFKYQYTLLINMMMSLSVSFDMQFNVPAGGEGANVNYFLCWIV